MVLHGHLSLLQSSSTLLEPGHLDPPTQFRVFERRPPAQLLLQDPTLHAPQFPGYETKKVRK